MRTVKPQERDIRALTDIDYTRTEPLGPSSVLRDNGSQIGLTFGNIIFKKVICTFPEKRIDIGILLNAVIKIDYGDLMTL